MAQDLLQEFFHKKKQKATPVNTDWAGKRDSWIKAVDESVAECVQKLGSDKSNIALKIIVLQSLCAFFVKSFNFFFISATKTKNFLPKQNKTSFFL